MDPLFYCVVEGITDYKVLKKILQRFYNKPNLKIECLQPALDETDLKQKKFGGWGNALNYLKSEDFKISCDFADYIIIQIDSDICEALDVPLQLSNSEKDSRRFIDSIKEKICLQIDKALFPQINSKLKFAIATNSIECWLLPLVYNDSRKGKTVNCLSSLNQKLKKQGFTIDANAKNKGNYYDELLKNISRKDVLRCAQSQFSLNEFLKSLPKKF